MISEKELSRIIQRPGYNVISGNAPQPKQNFAYAMPTGSKLEVKFLQLWEWLHGQPLEREVRFAPPRKFRADFVHVATKTMVEIEGFGHSKQNRYRPDVLKYNLAAEMGYVLYRLTSDMIHVNQLQTIINFIAERSSNHV